MEHSSPIPNRIVPILPHVSFYKLMTHHGDFSSRRRSPTARSPWMGSQMRMRHLRCPDFRWDPHGYTRGLGLNVWVLRWGTISFREPRGVPIASRFPMVILAYTWGIWRIYIYIHTHNGNITGIYLDKWDIMKQQYNVILGFVMLCPRTGGGYTTNHGETMRNDDQPPDR